MGSQIRVLPVLIFMCLFMLFVRVDNIFAASKEIAAEAGKTASEKPAPEKAAEAVAKPSESPDAAAINAESTPAGGTENSSQDVKPADKTADPLLFNDSELDILQSLAARRDQLDQRERQIEQKEGLLQITEQRIDQKIEELKTLKAELEASKQELDKFAKSLEDKQNEKLAGLVKTYESMKPKDAARIFDQLEMPVLLSIIGQMKDAKMGPILASMDPGKAKAVTTELARKKMPGAGVPASVNDPKMIPPPAPEAKKP